MSERTALVIGGTGQIGVATALALAEAGWRVTVAHRGRQSVPPELDVETVQLDREDGAALAAASAGTDLLVDTVAFTPAHAAQLQTLDVGRLVVVSSAAVYAGANGSYLEVATDEASFPDYPVPIPEDWTLVDNDEQTYSPLKAAMERVLLAGRVPVSILRAGAIHGPHSPALREWYYIKRALDERPQVVLAHDGAGRFHPAGTRNLAALVLACAATPGTHVLNAVDEECPSDADIARTVYAALDREVEVVTFPGPPRESVGASPWAIPKPFVLSMERAHREVGYVAPLTYAQGVEEDIAWVRSRFAETGASSELWQDALPGLWGSEGRGWFDYAAEDTFLAGRSAASG